jgi:chromosome segregation ATPase
MAGVLGTLQEVLTIVQRLSALENRIEREFRELKDGLSSARSEARELDRRLLVLETRFGDLAELAATEARAAAQSAASLAVAGELRAIGERIARLEGVTGTSPHGRALRPPDHP